MAAPFGFSVGDFITLGKLIGQVAVEIREVSAHLFQPSYNLLTIWLRLLIKPNPLERQGRCRIPVTLDRA